MHLTILSWSYFCIVGALASSYCSSAAIEEQLATPIGEQQVLDEQVDDMPMNMDTPTFMKIYTLDLENEWELDGKSPKWGPSTGRPLKWGEENARLDLPNNDRQKTEYGSDNDHMTVSPDGKLLVISADTVIRVYNMAEKDLRAELVGHLGSISSIVFAPEVPPSLSKVHYTLLSQGSTERERGMYSQDNTIVVWHLDASGKPLITTTPIPIEDLATKALNAISPTLTNDHDLSTSAISDLNKSFIDALQVADIKNLQQNLTSFSGTFPSFGSTPVSHDGTRLLYVLHNTSTQSGQRSADLMPQILVRDLWNPTIEKEPIATLQGYTDGIMWSAFSPTNSNIIASAAWDGTYRIWDLSTPAPSLLHKIHIKGDPQNWSGAFSPDGERVLLAGTDNVSIYSVSNGSRLHSLSEKHKLASWVRSMAWNPVDDAIALVNGAEVLLWEPSIDRVSAVVTLARDRNDKRDRMLEFFREFRAVEWLSEDILAAKAPEDSWLVWDRKRGLKWRFTRPKGVEGQLYSTDCALVEREDGKKVFVGLDGDRVVREWVLE